MIVSSSCPVKPSLLRKSMKSINFAFVRFAISAPILDFPDDFGPSKQIH